MAKPMISQWIEAYDAARECAAADERIQEVPTYYQAAASIEQDLKKAKSSLDGAAACLAIGIRLMKDEAMGPHDEPSYAPMLRAALLHLLNITPAGSPELHELRRLVGEDPAFAREAFVNAA